MVEASCSDGELKLRSKVTCGFGNLDPFAKLCAKKTGMSGRNRTNISNRRRHIPVKYIPTKQDAFFLAGSPLFYPRNITQKIWKNHPKNLEKVKNINLKFLNDIT